MSIVTYNNRSIRNISAIPGAAKSLTHIKTLTASSDSTLSFVDGSSDVVLDSTYPIYLFKFINVHPASNSQRFTFQGNASGGSGFNETMTTTHFQAEHSEGGTSDFRYRTASDQAQGTSFQAITQQVGNDNDECFSGSLTLFNPSSTTFVKHFISRCQEYENSNYSQDVFTAGYFNTTSAIDEIQFKFESGNIDAGTIKLYGLKDS
tara:strand:+ start:106 stop:723 length:618 start_codon:yes stop_codon:yes gene_type:complete